MRVELAGIKPEDVDIEVTDGVLTLSGERSVETESDEEGWVIRESREARLPERGCRASLAL